MPTAGHAGPWAILQPESHFSSKRCWHTRAERHSAASDTEQGEATSPRFHPKALGSGARTTLLSFGNVLSFLILPMFTAQLGMGTVLRVLNKAKPLP